MTTSPQLRLLDPDLVPWAPPDPPDIKGATYNPWLDGARLGAQLARVLAVMERGEWVTLASLAREAGAPEASVSARLRDLRRLKRGAVERRRVVGGLWEYRLVPTTRDTEAA